MNQRLFVPAFSGNSTDTSGPSVYDDSQPLCPDQATLSECSYTESKDTSDSEAWSDEESEPTDD